MTKPLSWRPISEQVAIRKAQDAAKKGKSTGNESPGVVAARKQQEKLKAKARSGKNLTSSERKALFTAERMISNSARMRFDAEKDTAQKAKKMRAAGASEEVISRATGLNEAVVVESDSGVSVTLRGENAQSPTGISTVQDRFAPGERQGTYFDLDRPASALQRDAQGRTYTDQVIAYNREMNAYQAALQTPAYAINFPVYGPPPVRNFPVYGPPPVRSKISNRGMFGGGEIRTADPVRRNILLDNPFSQGVIFAARSGYARIQGRRDVEAEYFLNQARSDPSARGGLTSLGAGLGGVGLLYGSARVGLSAAKGYLTARAGLTSTTLLQRTGLIFGSSLVAATAPDFASRLSISESSDRAVLQDPAFQRAYEDAVSARTSGLGPVGRFVDAWVPGIGPTITDIRTRGRSSEAFDRAFTESIGSAGLSYSSRRDLAQDEFRARQAGGFVGLVAANFGPELVGRTVFSSAPVGQTSREVARRAFVSTIPAGALEGALVYATSQRTRRQDLELAPMLFSSGIGASTAPVISGFIAGTRFAGQKRGVLAETLLSVEDPFEISGDFLADVVTQGPLGGLSARLLRGFPTRVGSQSVIGSAPRTGARTNPRVWDATPTTSEWTSDFSMTPTRVNLVVPVRPVNPVRPYSVVPVRSVVPVSTRTPTRVRTPVNPVVPVRPIVPVNPVVPVRPVNPVRPYPIVPVRPINPVRPLNPVRITPTNWVTNWVWTFDNPFLNPPGSGERRGRGFDYGRGQSRSVLNIQSLTASLLGGKRSKRRRIPRSEYFVGTELRF
jgi:hypothetical protein